MARQKGLVKFEGTLDGVTFYKNGDGNFVRMAGGINKKRIMNDPAFARTRENINEFGHNAKGAKFLRDTAGTLVTRAKDSRTSTRLMKIFNQIQNLDTVSDRGQRKIHIGLAEDEGKNLIKGFDFNKNAALRSILKSDFILDTTSGVFTMNQMQPALHLLSPQGATHCSMSLGTMNLDFDLAQGTLVQSDVENFILDANPIDLTLTAAPPDGTGTVFFLLLLEFFQEVNAKQYPLNNGAFNALNIIEVA